jgi:hypothetical protein
MRCHNYRVSDGVGQQSLKAVAESCCSLTGPDRLLLASQRHVHCNCTLRVSLSSSYQQRFLSRISRFQWFLWWCHTCWYLVPHCFATPIQLPPAAAFFCLSTMQLSDHQESHSVVPYNTICMAPTRPLSATAKPLWLGFPHQQLATAAAPSPSFGHGTAIVCGSSSFTRCTPNQLDLLVVCKQRR